MIKKVLFILLMLVAKGISAQPQMADEMRSNGKIYVVIGVISIIFVAIIALLIVIERKLSKLEKQDQK